MVVAVVVTVEAVHFEILRTSPLPPLGFLVEAEGVVASVVASAEGSLVEVAVEDQLVMEVVVEEVEVVVVPLVLGLHLTLLEIYSQKFLLMVAAVKWKPLVLPLGALQSLRL